MLRHVRPEDAYQPNVANRQVRRRLEAGLAWAEQRLSPTVPKQLQERWITEVLGQQQNRLSAWLRRHLVQRRSGYLVGKRSIEYTLNVEGAHKVRSLLHGEPLKAETYLERLERVHTDELASHEYAYREASHRRWHPLQGVKKEDRTTFWGKHGLPFEYDAQACAPTLICQLALRRGALPLLLAPIAEYLRDREGLRAHVMALAQCDHSTAKTIINSLFNGARLQAHHACSLYDALGRDRLAMDTLKSDPRVSALRRAIAVAWRSIGADKRERWNLYFHEERRVLDVLVGHCTDRGIAHFTIHDGIRTALPLDLRVLEQEIKDVTGYVLTINQS